MPRLIVQDFRKIDWLHQSNYYDCIFIQILTPQRRFSKLHWGDFNARIFHKGFKTQPIWYLMYFNKKLKISTIYPNLCSNPHKISTFTKFFMSNRIKKQKVARNGEVWRVEYDNAARLKLQKESSSTMEKRRGNESSNQFDRLLLKTNGLSITLNTCNMKFSDPNTIFEFMNFDVRCGQSANFFDNRSTLPNDGSHLKQIVFRLLSKSHKLDQNNVRNIKTLVKYGALADFITQIFTLINGICAENPIHFWIHRKYWKLSNLIVNVNHNRWLKKFRLIKTKYFIFFLAHFSRFKIRN